MSGEIKFKTAKPLIKAQIVDEIGQVWDGSAMQAESALSSAEWTAGLITPTQGATTDPDDTGLWTADWPGGLTKLAIYHVLFYSGAAPVPGDIHIGVQQDPTEYGIERVADVYHAIVEVTLDEDNSQDEYSVLWLVNGLPILSGITSPLIQVVKRVDGSDLIAETAMTVVDGTGMLKYDEGTNRIGAGEAAWVKVSATIAGEVRKFGDLVSRDLAA